MLKVNLGIIIMLDDNKQSKNIKNKHAQINMQ